MKLPRRTYYYKPKKKPSAQALIKRMEQMCLDFPRYGYRRVTKQLQREGWIINHKKVARIMREKGWSCRPRKRKWICTTDSNHNFRVYPNLIQDRLINPVEDYFANTTLPTTDELVAMAREISDKPARREMDMLLSTGERITMSLLSMALPLIHHGMIYVGIPWTEEALATTTTGGTPYGASHVSWSREHELSGDETDLARALGRRVAEIAAKLA